MKEIMSKGFLIFAQNTDSIDYVKQAYALALSIKHSQTEITSVSLITNDNVADQYKAVFDNIIPIPWYDATGSHLKAEHRWKLYYASPYDETIVLDSDMLMLDDISYWWKYLSNYDLKFCSHITNYKLEPIFQDTYHRKAFIANKLTNPYFALHYFKKGQAALDFYKTLEFVIKNWELCYGKFAPEEYQNWVSMDLSAAVAIDILGLDDTAIDKYGPLEFVHMKTPLQGWLTNPAKWQDTVPHYFTRTGDLYVANIKQTKLFHYVEKDFLTDNIISKLEDLCKTM
jgi:hypothetical protein